MQTIYADITAKGKTIYYRNCRVTGRYIRIAEADAVLAIAAGEAERVTYLPRKPYESYTMRQLLAAQKLLEDGASARLISAELRRRAAA